MENYRYCKRIPSVSKQPPPSKLLSIVISFKFFCIWFDSGSTNRSLYLSLWRNLSVTIWLGGLMFCGVIFSFLLLWTSICLNTAFWSPPDWPICMSTKASRHVDIIKCCLILLRFELLITIIWYTYDKTSSELTKLLIYRKCLKIHFVWFIVKHRRVILPKGGNHLFCTQK